MLLFWYESTQSACSWALFIFYPQGYNNSKSVTLEASFTPDSQFVMIGKSKSLSHVFSSVLEVESVIIYGKEPN